MISANNVTLRVGKKALFEDVNIKFTEGNCYGLIGANGAGKSTFLRILSGQLEPTKGDVSITPGQRLSFLQQDHFKYDDYTVLDTVIMGNPRLYEIMKDLTDREERVLRLRYGLDDNRPRTLEEVGREFGVTRERIRQIEAKAIRKLRHPTRAKRLGDYRDALYIDKGGRR